jgi:hypothetical protein
MWLQTRPLSYFVQLSRGKTLLWCYLIWYLSTLWQHWDPTPRIWINSLGISLIIGVGLKLSVAPAGKTRAARWQTLRLFLMPFCVSSFASLIKGRNFIFIFPSATNELLISIAACALFVLAVAGIKAAATLAEPQRSLR